MSIKVQFPKKPMNYFFKVACSAAWKQTAYFTAKFGSNSVCSISNYSVVEGSGLPICQYTMSYDDHTIEAQTTRTFRSNQDGGTVEVTLKFNRLDAKTVPDNVIGPETECNMQWFVYKDSALSQKIDMVNYNYGAIEQLQQLSMKPSATSTPHLGVNGVPYFSAGYYLAPALLSTDNLTSSQLADVQSKIDNLKNMMVSCNCDDNQQVILPSENCTVVVLGDDDGLDGDFNDCVAIIRCTAVP